MKRAMAVKQRRLSSGMRKSRELVVQVSVAFVRRDLARGIGLIQFCGHPARLNTMMKQFHAHLRRYRLSGHASDRGRRCHAYRANHQIAEPDTLILTLDLDQPIVEHEEASPLDLALHEDPRPCSIFFARSTRQGRSACEGLVARFGTTQPTLAQAQEIRAALARFRAAGGKLTYAFGSDLWRIRPRQPRLLSGQRV